MTGDLAIVAGWKLKGPPPLAFCFSGLTGEDSVPPNELMFSLSACKGERLLLSKGISGSAEANICGEEGSSGSGVGVRGGIGSGMLVAMLAVWLAIAAQQPWDGKSG